MDSFGIEAPGRPPATPHRAPARFLVLIDAGGSAVARLYTAARTLSAEFDAGSEEVAVMTQGLTPAPGALEAAWDSALQGHSASERAGAMVYTLDV